MDSLVFLNSYESLQVILYYLKKKTQNVAERTKILRDIQKISV